MIRSIVIYQGSPKCFQIKCVGADGKEVTEWSEMAQAEVIGILEDSLRYEKELLERLKMEDDFPFFKTMAEKQ